MNSIRTKITLLTVCAIVAAMTVATLLNVAAIRRIGDSSSKQLLLLLCRTGEKNLDSYFRSVEQSVEMIAAFAEADLDGLERESLENHMNRANAIFRKTVNRTNGVLTYYYRIDPAVSDSVEGFWYVWDGEEFREHEVTDITRYDMEDTSSLVWFTVTKAAGKSVWLPPYITENLDARVVSYNVPIYWNGLFVGVVGIEIDYDTLAEQADNIRLYENGYAFISDEQGRFIYHPRMDMVEMADANQEELPVPPDLLSEDTSVRYTFEGVEKQAVWLPLENGMRLTVTVPVSEINASWLRIIYRNFAASVFLLILFILLTMQFTGHITAPLLELTRAAEQVNAGHYDFELRYSGNDEVGILTQTFLRLSRYLKSYISVLNDRAYTDALTSVRNKGGFDVYLRELRKQVEDADGELEFAVGVFDCDGLKSINDRYGHDKGDIYLKTASAMICRVFQHSPVFRTGGDEFTVIMRNEDYRNREELGALFAKLSGEACAMTDVPWEQVRVSVGIAVFTPETECSVDDVVRRADKLMYENKRSRKAVRQG